MARDNQTPEIRFKRFTDPWEQRKFSNVFDGLQNNTLSRAELNYENGTVKNVHYGDVLIKFGDYIDVSKIELPFISDDTKVEKFTNAFLQDGDIVIADTAEDDTVGKCTEIRGSGEFKVLSGLHTIPCRPKERYGKKFLGYYMNSPAYHNQLKPLMQGIKVTSISKTALQDTDMLVPVSIEEQAIIGDYFANIDNLITLHQRKLEKTQNFKKAMLEKMFPQNGESVPEIRFAGFTEPWEQRKAEELFISYADKGHPYLPVLSATQDRGMIRRDENDINIFHDKSNEAGYKRVLPGQFVIHLRSFQGGFAHSSLEGITSPAYTVFGFSEPQKHDDIFWKYIFSSKEFIRRLETVTYGIRDGRSISYDEFLTMKFRYPSKSEQSQIARHLTEVDKLITLHQRKLEKLQNIKKSMLEKMFV